MMKKSEAPSRNRIIQDTERCVKCALCLPHCPTYGLTHEEGDSPRGRIALMQAIAEGTLEPGAGARDHLEGCLTCRACEAVCPAGVPYGRLIDDARALLPVRGRKSPASRVLRRLAFRPRLLATLLRLARPFAGLPLPLPGRGLLRAARPARLNPPTGPETGEKVQLFLGCVARALDADTLRATAALLSRAGYDVEIPAGQGCCGALAQHAGERPQAIAHARRNAAAFRGTAPIIETASGCGAQLVEYEPLLADEGAFARRVQPVEDWLAKALENGRLRPLQGLPPVRVALHTPCTQRNVLRGDAPRRCLEALPNVEIIPLPAACCGAAGTYCLDRPEAAARLREPHREAIHASGADAVVTTNVGCRLHLADGLDEDIPVIHLAGFLESRLGSRSAGES